MAAKRLGDPILTTPSKLVNWVPMERTPEKRRPLPISVTNASPTKQLQKKTLTGKEPVQTYVFFDLECTGLINDPQSYKEKCCLSAEELSDHLNQSCIRTRLDQIPYITEMSFCAVARETFDEFKEEMKKKENWNKTKPDCKQDLVQFVPLNTHTRQVNPMMKEEEWFDYERKRSTRNANVLIHPKKRLLRCNSFKEEWPGVVQFLESLQKPAVLIGHNALEYDLRVIHGELSRNGLLKEYGIPQDVYFVDSLLMARKVEKEATMKLADFCQNFEYNPIRPHNPIENAEAQSADLFVEPIREPTSVNGVLAPDHPLHSFKMSRYPVAVQKRIRRDGFVRTAGDGWDYKPADNRFKLEIMYEDLLGVSYPAHYAQPDAIAMMNVCMSYGDEFSKYADSFAAGVPF